jgi:hypothetical protein
MRESPENRGEGRRWAEPARERSDARREGEALGPAAYPEAKDSSRFHVAGCVRPWIAPVGVGLAAFLLVAGLGPRLIDSRPPPPEPWQVAAEEGHVWPFEAACGEASFLLVAPDGRNTAGLADERLDWVSGNLALYNATAGDPARTGFATALPCAPRPAGPNATVYVFLATGRLLASNAPEAEQARFRKDSSYVPLPGGAWNGTALPPEWQEVLRPLEARLRALPAGGVFTAVLWAHPYAEALGPLAVTVRAGPAPAETAPAAPS